MIVVLQHFNVLQNSCGYTKLAVEKTTLFVGGLPMSMKDSDALELFQSAIGGFKTLILKSGPHPCFISGVFVTLQKITY